jgi:hypothetical protein
MDRLSDRQTALLVFVFSFAYVFWIAGNRLMLTNDEGIFLSQAMRISQGEVLYRDLFGLTGPASYWLLALAFKLGGVTLRSAHVILATEIAVLTAIVYFATRKLSDRTSAAFGALVFLVFNVADPAMMTNNHRWDADTYAICGILAIWRGRPMLGGVLLALSVWATPIFALTALTAVVAALLVGQSPFRVIAGGAMGAAGGVVALALNGSLLPYIQNLLWVKNNYSEVNRMPYGSVIGGYPALFEGASGVVEWGIRLAIVAVLTLPVWLPPLCGVLLIRQFDKERLFLFICGMSMIAAVTPRYDVGHLVFAVPLFYPLAASFLPRARWAIVPAGALTLLFLFSTILQWADTQVIQTRFGTVRTDAGSAETVRWLSENIQPGERMFVYPYPPIAYVLTRGQNVSRYSYLHPGLFTEADERLAEADLMRNQPAKVLYMEIAEQELLRMWPASDPTRLQLRHLHQYVLDHFEPGPRHGKLQIYVPKPRVTAAQAQF